MAVFDPTTPDEVWYPVPSYPPYQLSSDMRVRRPRYSGQRLSPPGEWYIVTLQVLRSGYLYFQIRENRKPWKKKVVFLQWLVADVIFGPRPDGMLVLHRDDDKRNNYPSNLRYGTKAENATDALRNGRAIVGSRHLMSKLTEDGVREIRRRHAAGETQQQLADCFEVRQSLISMAVNRKIWRHVD